MLKNSIHAISIGVAAMLLSGCAGAGWMSNRASIVEPAADAGAEPSAATAQADVPKPAPSSANTQPDSAPSDASPVSGSAQLDDSTVADVLKSLTPLDASDPKVLADFRRALNEADPQIRELLIQRLTSPRDVPQPEAPASPQEISSAKPVVVESSPQLDIARSAPSDDQSAQSKIDSSTRSILAPAPPQQISPPQHSETSDLSVSDATPADDSSQETVSDHTEPGAWKKEVRSAIDMAQRELSQKHLNKDERTQLETYLRLLYLIENRREEAVKPIRELEENQQEFWSEQIYALSEILDSQGMPLADRRSTLALRHLRKAEIKLANVSALDLRNLAFCTRVDSFGQFKEFPKYEFKPNQEVLLYFEVDNFTITERPAGFVTSLLGSYQIMDAQQRRVAEYTFDTNTEISHILRRDFFIRYPIYMPKTIPQGDYTLQLTVEDLNGDKFGQGSIKFRIGRSR